MLDRLCERFAQERGITLKPVTNGKRGLAHGVSIDHYFLGSQKESFIIAKDRECQVTVLDIYAPDHLLMMIELARSVLPDYLAMLSRSSEAVNQAVLQELSKYLTHEGRAIDNLSRIFSLGLSDVSPVVDCFFPSLYAPRR